jgi:hypothetical protein
VDHIVSVRDGGTDDLTNLRTLCWPCHWKRNVQDEWAQGKHGQWSTIFRAMPISPTVTYRFQRVANPSGEAAAFWKDFPHHPIHPNRTNHMRGRAPVHLEAG